MVNNTRLEIEKIIKQILVSRLEVNPELISTSSSDTPLLGRGIGLDSMETLTLVAAIEKEFDIEIADDDLTVDLFKSIGSLAEYILQRNGVRKTNG
jgi:acyl carrier protein